MATTHIPGFQNSQDYNEHRSAIGKVKGQSANTNPEKKQLPVL